MNLDFRFYTFESYSHLRMSATILISFFSILFFCHISSLFVYTHLIWTKMRLSRCKHFLRLFCSVKICWFSHVLCCCLYIFLYFYVYTARENLYVMFLYFKNYKKKIIYTSTSTVLLHIFEQHRLFSTVYDVWNWKPWTWQNNNT